MYEPDSKSSQTVEVECHAGTRHGEYPKRVKLNDIWYDIFHITQREVIEDYESRERRYIYFCHIGDNIIVKLIKDKAGWTRHEK